MTFFKELILPANNCPVTIRQVNAAELSQNAMLDALASNTEADLSGDVVDMLQKLGSGKEAEGAVISPATLRMMMGAAECVNRQMVEEAVVDMPALLAAYRSRGTERDFGLGPDFGVLVAAIRDHSGVPDVPAQTALQSLSGLLGAAEMQKDAATRQLKAADKQLKAAAKIKPKR